MKRKKVVLKTGREANYSKGPLDLGVVLTSAAWMAYVIAKWLDHLEPDIGAYGSHEATADLTGMSEILGAAAVVYKESGFELLVDMPKGMGHVNAKEWIESLEYKTEDPESDSDLPF